MLRLNTIAWVGLFACFGVSAQVADLSIAKSGPSAANNGDTFSYSLLIRNNGPDPANGATFNDPLPPGLSQVSASCGAPVGGAVCPASVSASSTLVSGSVPTLPSGGAVTITINGRFPVGNTSTSLTNTATVSVPAGVTESNPASNTSTINTSITYRQADIAVTKTTAAASAAVGVPISYTLSVTNNGPGPADGLQLRDRWQSIVSGTGLGGGITYAGGSVSCVPAGGAVCPAVSVAASGTIDTTIANAFVATMNTLPAGGSATFTVTVTPTGFAAGTCGYTGITLSNLGNYIALPTNVVDPVAGNNTQTVNSAVTGAAIAACPQADIVVTKTQSSATVVFGTPQTYTITYSSAGPGNADGLLISDVLRSLVATIASGSGGAIIYGGGAISCTSANGAVCPALSFAAAGSISTATNTTFAYNNALVPSFPSGASIAITLAFTPTAFAAGTCGYTSATLTNTASVAAMPAAVTDPDTTNNTPTVSAVSPARPACPTTDLQVSKVVSSPSLSAGSPVTYTVTVSNAGAADVSNALLTDTIATVNGAGSGLSTLAFGGASFGACTTTGGAVCPALPILSASGTYSTTATNLISALPIPSLPAGSSISFPLTLTPTGVDNGCLRTGNNLRNTVSIAAPSGVIDSNAANNSATRDSTYSCVDLVVNKAVTPASAAPGDLLTFTVDVSNLGPANGVNIPFSDPLPGGFAYTGATCAVTSGTATCGAVNFNAGTNTVSSSIATLNSGAVVRFVISGTASGSSATWANTATVAAPAGLIDRLPGSNSSNVSFTVLTTDPAVSKTALTANPPRGGRARYQLIVSNPNNGTTLSGLTITDNLPAGLTYNNTVSVNLAGAATRPTTSNPTAGAATPVWGSFALPPGGSVTLVFEADVANSLTCGATLNNSFTANYTAGAAARSVTYNGNDAGQPADNITLRCTALGLAKNLVARTDNGDGSFAISYAVLVNNTGNEALNSVSITDPLSTAASGAFGTRVASGVPPPGRYRIGAAPAFSGACGLALTGAYNGDAGTAQLAGGTLAAGEICEIRFTILMAPTAGTTIYINQASGSGTGALSGAVVTDLSDNGSNADPASNNGTGGTNDPTPVTVALTPSISVAKTNSVTALTSGSNTTYTITVRNAGPSGVPDVRLQDAVSAGLGSCAIGACTVTSGTATCPAVGSGAGQLSIANLLGAGVLIPALNAGSEMTFAVSCTVTASGS